MLKNIHVNLVNAAVGCEILYVRTYRVAFDDYFYFKIDVPCSICEALEPVCYEMVKHDFKKAVITNAETGEIHAELKRVDEE